MSFEWNSDINYHEEEKYINLNSKELDAISGEEIYNWLKKTNIYLKESQNKETYEYTKEQYQIHKNILSSYIKDSCSLSNWKLVHDESSSFWIWWMIYTNPNITRKRWDRSTQNINYQISERNRNDIYNKVWDISSVSPNIIRAWVIKFNQMLSNYKYVIDSWLWYKAAKNKQWEEEIKKIPQIDIDWFMKEFMKDQENSLTVFEKQKRNEPVIIDPWSKDQKIWELIMEENSKKNILSNFQKANVIFDIQVLGRADATWPQNKEIPWEQVKKSIELLTSKWFNISLLNTVELPDWKKISVNEFLSDKEDKNKLNMTWAYARALMQIDFLPKEELQKIHTCPSFKIKIDAQDIFSGKKWDQYIGWGIYMINDWSVSFENKPIEKKNPTNEIPMPIIDLWEIDFTTMLWIKRVVKIFFDGNSIKLSQIDDGKIKNAWSSWSVYATAYGTIKYDTDKIKKPDSDKTVSVFVNDTNLLSDLWWKFNLFVDLEKDLWLKITKDVPWSWWFDTQWIVLNEVDANEFTTKFDQYLSNIEKTPDDFLKILQSYLADTTIGDVQKKYIKDVIKNISDAKNISPM